MSYVCQTNRKRRYDGIGWLGAYDSEAIALFSAALSAALAEVDRSPLRFSARAVKASFPVKITRQLIDAYDAGIRDLETLKKVGLSSVLPTVSD